MVLINPDIMKMMNVELIMWLLKTQ